MCHKYGWPHLSFDRYSDTLLVSLNNRISIRDTYGARGEAIECQLVTFAGSDRSEGTTDVVVLNTEKHQNYRIKHSLAEADMEDRTVN